MILRTKQVFREYQKNAGSFPINFIRKPIQFRVVRSFLFRRKGNKIVDCLVPVQYLVFFLAFSLVFFVNSIRTLKQFRYFIFTKHHSLSFLHSARKILVVFSTNEDGEKAIGKRNLTFQHHSNFVPGPTNLYSKHSRSYNSRLRESVSQKRPLIIPHARSTRPFLPPRPNLASRFVVLTVQYTGENFSISSSG